MAGALGVLAGHGGDRCGKFENSLKHLARVKGNKAQPEKYLIFSNGAVKVVRKPNRKGQILGIEHEKYPFKCLDCFITV